MRRQYSTLTCLLALFCLIFVVGGGCASKQTKLLNKKQKEILESFRLHVSETIKDPERARQLIALGEDLHKQIWNGTKILQKLYDDFTSMNKKYDTQRIELEVAFQGLNEHRRRMREKLLTARVHALKLTSPEEWQELMTRRRTVMDLIKETPGFL